MSCRFSNKRLLALDKVGFVHAKWSASASMLKCHQIPSQLKQERFKHKNHIMWQLMLTQKWYMQYNVHTVSIYLGMLISGNLYHKCRDSSQAFSLAMKAVLRESKSTWIYSLNVYQVNKVNKNDFLSIFTQKNLKRKLWTTDPLQKQTTEKHMNNNCLSLKWPVVNNYELVMLR